MLRTKVNNLMKKMAKIKMKKTYKKMTSSLLIRKTTSVSTAKNSTPTTKISKTTKINSMKKSTKNLKNNSDKINPKITKSRKPNHNKTKTNKTTLTIMSKTTLTTSDKYNSITKKSKYKPYPNRTRQPNRPTLRKNHHQKIMGHERLNQSQVKTHQQSPRIRPPVQLRNQVLS